MNINVAGFVNDSITDGPGIRFTIFCQGCAHHCAGCHNPETWEFGKGTDKDINDIYNMIKANPLVKGVTFSGGEPFAQSEAFAILAERLKADGYEVACYTGYTYEEILNSTNESMKRLLKSLDVLVDGKFILDQRDILLKFRGSKNQRIIDVQKSLANSRVIINDTERWGGEPKFAPITRRLD